MIIEKEYWWGVNDMMVDYWLPTISIAATGIFAGLVWSQVKNQKKDFQYKNKIETFKQLEIYREKYIPKHDDIINKFNDEKIDLKPKFGLSLNETRQAESLANHFEILAIKQEQLELNISVIYEIMGEMIFLVMKDERVKKHINVLRMLSSRRFVHLDKLMEKLEEYEKKINHQ